MMHLVENDVTLLMDEFTLNELFNTQAQESGFIPENSELRISDMELEKGSDGFVLKVVFSYFQEYMQ